MMEAVMQNLCVCVCGGEGEPCVNEYPSAFRAGGGCSVQSKGCLLWLLQ